MEGFDPDAFLANAENPQAPEQHEDASGFDPDAFLADSNEEKFGSTGQQFLTGVEGAAKGVAGPLATAVELGLSKLGVPGLSAEEQTGRAETNPIIHGLSEAGGFGAGMFTGASEAGLLAKAGKFIPEALEGASAATKIGTAALRGALETGLFQGGDEISKAMLGQGDPETPVASALSNIGAASLLGGGIGGAFGVAGSALKKLADTKMGSKATQFIEDFGNRWKFNQENPDMAEAVANELHDFHGSTKAAADEVYGSQGLKAQAIEKLVPEMNESIGKQNQKIANTLQSKITEMVGDPDTYPTRLTKKLVNDVNQWMEIATDPAAKSIDSFNATQDLKQKLQSYAKYDKQVAPFAAEKDFVNSAKDLAYELRNHLEDPKVWGKAGELQQGVNKAFTEFLPSLKDFERRFTTKVEGDPVIDPGKIKTYVNQVGKPNAEIKQTMMENFVDAAEKYRNRISDLHESVGVDSPLSSHSLNAVKSTLGAAASPGAQAADEWFHVGQPGFQTRIAHSIIGAEAGRETGGLKGAVIGGSIGLILPRIEKAIGRQLTRSAIPTVLKVLSSGKAKNIAEAIDYAGHADSGAQKIKNGIESLFRSESSKAFSPDISEPAREKLKKYIENGKFDDELNAQQQELNAQAPAPETQNFADGGYVQSSTKPAAPIAEGTNTLATHFPEQNVMIQAAKSRINNYLNSNRPQKNMSKLPFDKDIPDKAKEKKYNNMLDLANQPLSILHNVKNGTVTAEQVHHLSSMYPEVYNHLSKKMTERITKAQVDGDTPSYATRKGMSLFLQAPLDSSMSAQTIQSVQAVYAKSKAQAPAPGNASGKAPSKSSTSALTKLPNSYKTQGQALETRNQRDH